MDGRISLADLLLSLSLPNNKLERRRRARLIGMCIKTELLVSRRNPMVGVVEILHGFDLAIHLYPQIPLPAALLWTEYGNMEIKKSPIRPIFVCQACVKD